MPINHWHELVARAMHDFEQNPYQPEAGGERSPRTFDEVLEDYMEYVAEDNAETLLADMMAHFPDQTAREFMRLDLTDQAPWQVVRSIASLLLIPAILAKKPELEAENQRREAGNGDSQPDPSPS